MKLSLSSIAVLGLLAFGCQSSPAPDATASSSSSSSSSGSVASHDKHSMSNDKLVMSHDPEVCELPGQGTAVAGAPTTKPADAAVAKPVAKYGAAAKLSDAEAVPVADVLGAPDSYNGKYVRMKGVVSSVCAQKGCWLRLTPDGSTKASNVFVKFKDPPEGRLIPMAAVGHEVTVEGTVKNATISEAAARHFLQDAGVSQQELEKIVGPQKQVMVAGPSVQIDGVAQDAE